MSINGLPSTSATATPQRLAIFSPGKRYTFVNEGAGSVFLRTAEGPVGAFAGTEAELRAVGFRAAEIKPSETLNVTVPNSKVDVVCGTSVTATLRIVSGDLQGNPESARTPTTTQQTVDSAGTSQVLAASTPYKQCALLAMKPGASAGNAPTANTGVVYIHSGTTKQYSFTLTQGDSMQLPDNCDLNDWLIDAATTNDGVIIIYTE